MNEYVIHAKVKNNLIFGRILAQGYANVSVFCEANGLRSSEVGDFINLKKRALDRNGHWYLGAQRVADALGVLPDELFTEEQQAHAVKTNQAYIELNRRQALEMTDPLQALEDADLVGKILSSAKTTTQEQKILRLRYFEDFTIQEVAEMEGVSTTRIRQVEDKALRRLRQANRHVDPAEYEERFGTRTTPPQVGAKGDSLTDVIRREDEHSALEQRKYIGDAWETMIAHNEGN